MGSSAQKATTSTRRRGALWLLAAVLVAAAAATAFAVSPPGQRFIASLGGRTADGIESLEFTAAGASESIVPERGWRVEGPIGGRAWLTSPDESLAVSIEIRPEREDPAAFARDALASDADADADAEVTEAGSEALASGLSATHASASSVIVVAIGSSPALGITARIAEQADPGEARLMLARLLETIGMPPGEAPTSRPDTVFSAVDIDGSVPADTVPTMDHRIAHAGLGIQASFSYIPGGAAEPFNARVDEIVRTAIDLREEEIGTDYRPTAGDGLAERGCAGGSTAGDAEALLSRAGSGDGPGASVTCDIVLAAGPVLGMQYRIVHRGADGVELDRTETWYVDTSTGVIAEPADLWLADTAPTIWQGLVERLRREAGSLSFAPVEPPNTDETEALQRLLTSTRMLPDGSLAVTVPGDFDATALSGMQRSTDPITVAVPLADAKELLSPVGTALADAVTSDPEYTGPALGAAGDDRIDCTLVPCVAVTYDDGPTELTPGLLDVLAEHHAAATFFMLGGSASHYPDIVQRVAAEGHDVANHTWRHPDLSKASASKVRKELGQTTDLLSELTGEPVTMFRPPYGAFRDATLRAAGLPAIIWDVDTLDWTDPGTEALVESAIGSAEAGSIILFHDTHAGTVEAAPQILDGLADRGFTLVTMTQLYGGAMPAAGLYSMGPEGTRAE